MPPRSTRYSGHKVGAAFVKFLGCNLLNDSVVNLEAVASGRAADAWELLSKSARARTTPEAFQRRVASLDEAHRRRIAQKATQVGLGRWSAHWDDADWPLRMENRGPRVWVVSSELPRFDRRDSPLVAREGAAHIRSVSLARHAFASGSLGSMIPV